MSLNTMKTGSRISAISKKWPKHWEMFFDRSIISLLYTFDFVERVETSMSSESSRACSNMADHEEAVVLACTSLVFLCFVRTRKETRKKDNTQCGLKTMRKRETFGCYNSLLMSD